MSGQRIAHKRKLPLSRSRRGGAKRGNERAPRPLEVRPLSKSSGAALRSLPLPPLCPGVSARVNPTGALRSPASEPRLLLHHVFLVELLVGLDEVEDPLD